MLAPVENVFPVQTFGIENTLDFGIGDIGIIFDILRNKLYKDPIVAVVREISANARDAHREINKPDLPIQITIPNAWNPEFKIKDFGPGIHPSRMEDIFVKYAASNKRGDNKQQGYFGIGSKSCFSYVDSFTVLTVVDGYKYTYTAFLDESKIGKMNLIQKIITDESNGTEIILPVATNDHYKFAAAVFNITQHWEIRPIILGLSKEDFKYSVFETLLEGDNWKVFQKSKNDYSYAKAILDGIVYDLAEVSTDGLSNLEKNLLNIPLYLYFGVGKLAISASRDSLHFNDLTNETIKNKLKIIAGELERILNNKIIYANSYREACVIYKSLYNTFGEGIMNSVPLSWNNLLLKRNLTCGDFGDFAHLSSYERKYSELESSHKYNSLYFTEGELIIYNDTGSVRPSYKLIKQIFDSDLSYKKAVVISTPNNSAEYELACKRAASNGTIAPELKFNFTLINALNPIYLSSIKLKKEPRLSKDKVKISSTTTLIKTYKLKLENSSNIGSSVFLCEKAFKQIFVKYDYKKKECYCSDGTIISSWDLSNLKNNLGFSVVGLSTRELAKVPSNWVWLDKEIDSFVNQQIVATGGMDELVEIAATENYRGKINNLKNKVSLLNDASVMKQFILKFETYRNNFVNYKGLINFLAGPAKSFNKNFTLLTSQDIENAKFFKEVKDIEKRYPLLNHIDYYNSTEAIIESINYINLVDKSGV